jgi:hypothetical protein
MSDQEIQNRAHKLYSKLFGARTREDSLKMIEEEMKDLHRSTKTQTKREIMEQEPAQATG